VTAAPTSPSMLVTYWLAAAWLACQSARSMAYQATRASLWVNGTVALSRNVPGKPSKWRLSFMEGRQERVEPLDRAYDLSSLGGEVEAVARGDRSMQQCPPPCSTHPAGRTAVEDRLTGLEGSSASLRLGDCQPSISALRPSPSGPVRTASAHPNDPRPCADPGPPRSRPAIQPSPSASAATFPGWRCRPDCWPWGVATAGHAVVLPGR
jgi:hypothetical protein